MGIRISFVALAAPLILLALLLAAPGVDKSWGTSSFHFHVVSAASLLAAGTCVVLVISARSIRQTRILFLALSFFSLATIFSVHGLATPGHLIHDPTAAIVRSPWLASLAAGFFAALSVLTIPRIVEQSRLRLPEIIVCISVAAVGTYFAVSLIAPNWLAGFPTEKEWFQHALTAITAGLLCFAAWRYLDSYLFTRLSSQLAVMCALLFLAEAQLSMDFGRIFRYSWWMYHGLFFTAFLSILTTWALELLRAKNSSSIAEAIAMRDALTQLNRGRSSHVVDLANQIENHDLDTFRHVDRVAAFAYLVGHHMGFGASRLRRLVLAGQMHDIGKIGLPPHILAKPGKLTDEEWAAVKLHPTKGWEIVGRAKALKDIASIVRHHHEQFDGGGYPDGLAADSIPLEARIISVADTFDALTSERPYRPAMSVVDAEAELLRVSGSQLDPNCVDTFLKLLRSGKVSLKRHREQMTEAVA